MLILIYCPALAEVWLGEQSFEDKTPWRVLQSPIQILLALKFAATFTEHITKRHGVPLEVVYCVFSFFFFFIIIGFMEA